MEIHGITVDLYVKTQTDTDDLGNPIYTENPVQVPNVIVAPVSDQEVLEITNLTGRKAVYQLGIPKGDVHDWINVRVGFFGQIFRTIGEPTEGIEDMIPLSWNKKIKVEIYNGE